VLYLQHATLFTPTRRIQDSALLVEGNRIAAVGTVEEVPRPPEARIVEAGGLFLAPGLIDLQLNGGFGLDFTADPSTIWEVAARLPQYGVTSFLPTIITSPVETVAAAQVVLRAGPPPGSRGATGLGLHLEGPFLNPAKRGAHNPAHLRLPAVNAIADWSVENGVRLVTLAPELPGALEVIRALRERGVVVSAGHSMATYDQARAGFEAGIAYGTHLFNAMPPLEHRAPSLAGALLTDPRAIVGLIPDGIHLHPAVVKLAWQSKGVAGVSVVTDAMAALGMPPGAYELGDFAVTVDGASARLSDGRLAGSLLSLDQGVRNLIAFTGCEVGDALSTVTTTPAKLLGLTDRGQVAPGLVADLILLTPDLQVVKTIVDGQIWDGIKPDECEACPPNV
jgi:N-acetylglucosamine-6-phosphate deacetylase